MEERYGKLVLSALHAKYEFATSNTYSIAPIIAMDILGKNLFRSSVRGASFHTKHSSNANVVQVVTRYRLVLGTLFLTPCGNTIYEFIIIIINLLTPHRWGTGLPYESHIRRTWWLIYELQ
jgi:hypothetical protein